MNPTIADITDSLQRAYDEQYADSHNEFREMGGKYKAANILKVCGERKFNKVLECGAGEGSILKHLSESAVFPELYALEISESGIKQIQNRNLANLKEVKKFNGYEIPYPDREFDLVYCSHVLEHVEHPRILLREIERVSKFQVFEIPLDYHIGIDDNTKHFLSYGHINIYTPSLFKFLLKSEGYEILNDTLTHTDIELTRLNWYKNMKLKKTVRREVSLRLSSFRNLLKRILQGKNRYSEYEYSAYTCLTKASGNLEIF